MIGRAVPRLVLLACLLLLALTGCSSKPPSPALLVNKEKLAFERGTYSWRSLTSGVIADYAPPPMLVKDMKPHNVAPGAELTILYSSKPTRTYLSEWSQTGEDGKEVSQTELDVLTFTFPTQPGTYIYSIRSEWAKGGGTYAFTVQVNQ